MANENQAAGKSSDWRKKFKLAQKVASSGNEKTRMAKKIPLSRPLERQWSMKGNSRSQDRKKD